MNGTQIGVICTVIVTIVTVAAFLRTVLRAARDREAKERETREAREQGAFDRGVASRAVAEQRLQDQLALACRERDAAVKRVEQLEARVEHLEDRRRGEI